MVQAEAPLILVADDDRSTRDSLVTALELEGYRAVAVPDGARALEEVGLSRPDAVVLDIGMPEVDGLSVCRRMRSRQDRTPVLILTARSEVSERISGLDAGADDYLSKPFSLDELLARLRALLRRTRYEEPSAALVVADLRLDETARRVWRGEREVELTKTEFDLLHLLMRNAGVVLAQGSIYEQIWGYDFGPDSKNLAVYIGYLRRKLGDDGAPQLIRTVRGVGYSLRAP